MYTVLEMYHISQAQTNAALTVLRWGKPFESEKTKVKALQVYLEKCYHFSVTFKEVTFKEDPSKQF